MKKYFVVFAALLLGVTYSSHALIFGGPNPNAGNLPRIGTSIYNVSFKTQYDSQKKYTVLRASMPLTLVTGSETLYVRALDFGVGG